MIYKRYLAEPIRSHPKYDTIAVAAIHVFANVDSIESKINEIETGLLKDGWLVSSQDQSLTLESLPEELTKLNIGFLASWEEAHANGLSFLFEAIESRQNKK